MWAAVGDEEGLASGPALSPSGTGSWDSTCSGDSLLCFRVPCCFAGDDKSARAPSKAQYCPEMGRGP